MYISAFAFPLSLVLCKTALIEKSEYA